MAPTVFWGTETCQGRGATQAFVGRAVALILMGDWCAARPRNHEHREPGRAPSKAPSLTGNDQDADRMGAAAGTEFVLAPEPLMGDPNSSVGGNPPQTARSLSTIRSTSR